MKLLLATCAVSLVFGYGAAAQAQNIKPPSGTFYDDQAAFSNGTPANGTQATSESASNLLAGSEGKFVYDIDGNEIGEISAVHTDAGGKQAAVVETERPLGMGVRQVLIPSDSLQPKPGGGFVTVLSSCSHPGHARLSAKDLHRNTIEIA